MLHYAFMESPWITGFQICHHLEFESGADVLGGLPHILSSD